MKVLQVNITGKSGSTGKIVNDLRAYLQSQGHDAIVAYSVDNIATNGFIKISRRWELAISRRLVLLGRSSYKGNPFAFRRLKKLIELECPDIVHLHCINCNCVNIYKTLKYLAAHKIKTVVTHHAEFFYTGNCPYSFECNKFVDAQCKGCGNQFYATSNKIFASPHKNWLRMYRAVNSFRKEDLHFVSVSPWVEMRSRMSPILRSFPCTTIFNGLDTSIFCYNKISKEIRSKIIGTTENIVLHVTPNFNPKEKGNIKGGYYVVELAKKMPHVIFLVVASFSEKTSDLPNNIQLWGKASSQEELAQLYSTAAITLLTSKKETFSMVTAESLCCGTPVIGFEAGGPESIAIEKYSRFVEYGNIEAIYREICVILDLKMDKEEISNESKKIYSKVRMSENYMSLYMRLLNQ